MGQKLKQYIKGSLEVAEAMESDGRKISVIKDYRKKSPMFHANVTWLDRWLVGKMLDVVGNPLVRISLSCKSSLMKHRLIVLFQCPVIPIYIPPK